MPTPRDRQEDASHRTHLPAVASSFIGRAVDLDAIAERFEDGAQLVTVIGLGGMGKTRVALRFAEAHAASFVAPGTGGVWFCDLTAARDPAAACAAVAAVLGIRPGSSADEATLADHLGRALSRRGRMLLVLDNFEQLAEFAEATLGRWMRAASRARFLVTSRVALGLAGEHRWPLRSLELPPADIRDERDLAAVESIDLFVRRARQIRPDLPLRPDDLVAIADVVRRLDGIPLAIELAAARVAVLSVAQLRDRLVQRLDLLVRPGDAGRHASMRRAIADTWEQLGAAEQACLAGFTIFAGGFMLDAAEAVLGSEVGAVLPVLESLCRHSLVRATPRLDLGGEVRFSLYETIREFAAERLAAAPELAARLADRHAAHYAEFGRALAVPAAAAGGQAAVRLAVELDNLIAAHAHAIADASPDAATRALALACGADRPLIRRGMPRTSLRLLDGAIARARGTGAPGAVAAAVLARGRAHRLLGAWQRARADFEEGLALARAAGDPTLAALGHMRIGEQVETDGATQEARERFTTALALLASVPGDPLGPLHEADVRAHLAHAWRREGALEHAEREILRSLELHCAAEHSDDLPMVFYEAGTIAMFRGRHDEALARFDEGLALVRSTDARQAEGSLLYVRAILLQARGDLDLAFDHYARAIELFREVGSLAWEASALYYFAGAHLERGQHDDARKLVERALAMFTALGVPRYQALTEGCRAALFAVAGDFDAARACLDAAERHAAACRSERALTATVAIHRLHVAMMGADPETRAGLLAEARALVEAHPSDDSRFALRAALACLPELGPRLAGAPLIIRAGARGFRVPGADQDVDLHRRAPLRRIVVALARKRLDAPGEALALEELLDAGWPGERVRDSAGANRVHVALSTLRNLGLRAFLVSGPDGYALTSASPCLLEDGE
ncbi:tetratricopeptide repeat protein [Nannocystis sp. SCPEA4]|uniref:ATP-binding protein n=1 Tax=Nannocystis sp. SCPEA4 TaxID=2996787 RepID=UPI002271B173|nr:tetratricopeptide repeat protein [Nannocystis sp. SCPEA4]MCY1054658.1 tetratricopeptide repeat protein [Nannocystis sp. SCPEA4]